jgi:uncharacterized protein (TIGR02611 family)
MTDEGERPRGGVHRALHANPVLALLTKVVVTVVGVVVTIVGVIMIVTPGPAVVLIPLGLAILATEWHWAYRLLRYARSRIADVQARAARVDPKVRRRRRVIWTAAVFLVAAGFVAYLTAYGWPGYALSGWDWAQARVHWLPDLPGM